MSEDDLDFDKEFLFEETPKNLFVKTEGKHADDHEAFIEDFGATVESVIAPKATPKPSWRNAKSLIQLKKQINTAYPNRKKGHDGHIGDNNHCSGAGHTGSSDHCLNIKDGSRYVVTAMDITHDAINCDVDGIVEAIRAAKDNRIKYIIWNKRICHFQSQAGKPPWAWRPYTGKNGHTKHAHFSVRKEKSRYDDISNWIIKGKDKPFVGA